MNIAIAGYGVEGKASYEYWNAKPDTHVTLVDERPIVDAPADAAIISGEGAFARLNGFDVVVRTAGLAPHKITTDGQIWSATNEFFKQCPAPIIGVTGSKGKGTTSSFIASILRAAGKKVWLVGNIGLPSLSVLDGIAADDIVVYELSSFQLWDLQYAPQVAVILYIEPEHLDVHADLDDYIAAKGRIVENQTTIGRVVYNQSNQWAVSIAEKSIGQRLPYPSEQTAHIKGDSFFYGTQQICGTDNVLLPGVHNLDNACAAITAVWSWVQEGVVIAEGLRSFDGLPHRLKLVRQLNGVRYYDDSIATTPGSALAAIAAFPEQKVLILGGSYKGADFGELAEKIATSDAKVKRVILIGDEAARIAQALDAVQYTAYTHSTSSLADTVTAAHAVAEDGDVVILSPACASFGQFKNYIDRGEQFIAAVDALV